MIMVKDAEDLMSNLNELEELVHHLLCPMSYSIVYISSETLQYEKDEAVNI